MELREGIEKIVCLNVPYDVRFSFFIAVQCDWLEKCLKNEIIHFCVKWDVKH